VMDETEGANCAEGGQAIRTGLDANRDGLLQPEEVAATQYVCNGGAGADGAEGFASLVRQEDEPAGSNCPFGGRAVLSGLDLNQNGYLEGAEVTATSYVCHGAQGEPGLANLLAVVDEPAGGNCPSGGQRVESGLDDNGDGSLDASEVDQATYLCDGGDRVSRVSNAAWGGVCQRGGLKVESGVDEDENGELDDLEVDRIEYVCNLFLVQVEAGGGHTCALISDQSVRCWGSNDSGQLGDGTTTHRWTPVSVSGLGGVAGISPGSFLHSCARLADGTARCWGFNAQGQLGDGTTTDRWTPVPVSGLVQVAEVTTGVYHS
jgi:hypothetical protein